MKYKVTTITTQYHKSTYMVDAVDEKDAVVKLVNHSGAAELINQEAYGAVLFPNAHDDFIVETF